MENGTALRPTHYGGGEGGAQFHGCGEGIGPQLDVYCLDVAVDGR
jgi:hypothetical protein